MAATWNSKSLKVTPIAADEVLIIDTADGGNQKRATLTSLGATLWSRNAGSGFIFQNTLTDKIGIGLNTPTESLDVLGNIKVSNMLITGDIMSPAATDLDMSSTADMAIAATSGAMTFDTTTGNMEFTTTTGDFEVLTITGDIVFNTNALFLDKSTSRIGINTTTPTELLQIFGGNFTLKPYNPTIEGTIQDGTNLNTPRRIYVVNNHAYVASSDGNSLTVIDITTPSAPAILGTLIDATNLLGAQDVFVAGNFAYVACTAGNSLTLIDISTPSIPVFKSKITISGAFAVYVSGVHAYVIDKAGNRLVVIDIHNPATLVQDGALTDATNFGDPSDVYVSGRYAYVTGESVDSLAIVDIIDDENPTTVGQVFDSTAMNSPQAVYIVGNHAYVASNVSDSLAIVDVGTPTAPSVTASLLDPVFESNNVLNGAKHIFVSENHAYITSEDADSFTIVDITVPATPAVVGSVNSGTTLNGSHGVFVSGKFAYVTASTNNSMSVMNIHGMDMPNANIGNLEVGSLSVKDNVIIADDLYASSITAGGDVLVGGQLAVSSKFSAFGDLTVADDTLHVDSTDKVVQIGGNTIATDLTVFQQATLAKKGFTLSGAGVTGGTLTTDGMVWLLGNATVGNMQAWLGQKSDVGNSTKSLFRYLTGVPVPSIDGVSGDGTLVRHINLGGLNGNVGIGFPVNTAVQADIVGQLHVKPNATNKIGQIIQAIGTQTVDLLQVRNSAGSAQIVVDENFRLGIGVINPTVPLHVVGDGKFTGALDMTDQRINNVKVLQINNPANTAKYDLTGSAITATRIVTLPVLTANDTFAFVGFGNVFTVNQRISSTNKLIFGDDFDTFIHQSVNNIVTIATANTTRIALRDEGVIIGDASTTTSRVNNFLHVPTSVGVPTGTPLLITGVKPLVFDSTNNDLYIYNSQWQLIQTQSTSAGLIAFAGGGQGSATILPDTINEVSTVATTADSVKLPAAAAGLDVTVINNGANSMNVFPNTGDQIDALAVNAAFAIPSGSRTIFKSYNVTNWVTF